ncbi:MAG: TolC family protein [Gammaproteobacteria bacterium]|nr:TolC family protein [Gammaproteobacteria bacterium]MDH3537694.1 TolC family protein [Gammaproteobacteria bacterium]
MGTNTCRIIGFSILLLCSGSVQAQQKLSLEQAIEMALNRDPRIEEKEAFVRQARGLLQEAEGSEGFRYSVDSFLALSTGLDGGFYEGGATTCSSGCRPRDDLYDFNDGLSLWAGLTFSIVKPLATFGRLENYQEAAQNNITVKQQDVALQRDEVALQVVKAYYGYLTARDSRLLLEDTRNRLEAALNLVNEWLEEGSGNARQSDKYALESGLGLIDNFLAEASGLEKIAMAGLKFLTGHQDEVIELADRRIMPVPLPDESLQDWIDLALLNRAEFKQVEAGLAARRALVEAKRADAKPIVFAGVAGSLAYSPDRERLDNPFIYDPFNHVAASPLVGMRWLWEQGAQPGRVAQAQAELDALVQKASFAREGIPFQVREQYFSMQAKYQAIGSMRESSRAARRWMIASYSDFEAGLEDADKIINALQVYVLTYAEYLRAVNDFNNLVSKLRSVSGVFQ